MVGKLQESRNIKIGGNAVGNVIVSGDGNRVVVFHQKVEYADSIQVEQSSGKSTVNPYKGLAYFSESDANFYFGREILVQGIWEKFQNIYERSITSGGERVLTILGPSGCGKSSLARAGLIPEFARHPLPEKRSIRVAVLKPGEKPVKSLSLSLACLVDSDNFDKSMEEYESKFVQAAENKRYDVLENLIDKLPGIDESPVLFLVDQFEELYSLCEAEDQQDTFIKNLISAASKRSGYTSLILTLRSDFLEETQRHSDLNQIVASNSVIVPAMTSEELYEAISKPSEQIGRPLKAGIIKQLVQDAEDRNGVLPLLQFTLQQIWNKWMEGVDPIKTYYAIGGVGGALAGEAQRIYKNLEDFEKDIARRIFLNLVQIGEDERSTTRRTTPIEGLFSKYDNPKEVRSVVDRFAAPSVRLITLFHSKDDNEPAAEITHEALIKHWQQLQIWLDDSRDLLSWKKQLRAAQSQWQSNEQDEGSLLQGIALAKAEEQIRKDDIYLTKQEHEFVELSLRFRTKKQREKKLQGQIRTGSIISVLSLIILGLIGFQVREAQSRKVRESVFLGADNPTPEIQDILPAFLQEAEQLRMRNHSQTFSGLDDAVSYYEKNKKYIKRDINYYRKIIEVIVKLRALHGDEDNYRSYLNTAESGLSYLIRKYRIPELKIQLQNEQFGEYTGGHTLAKDRFNEGALKTTYSIIIEDIGADLDASGDIRNQLEANLIPCEALRDIDNAWLNSNKKISWKANPDMAKNSSDVDLLETSLAYSVFNYAAEFIVQRFEQCEEKGQSEKTSQILQAVDLEP